MPGMKATMEEFYEGKLHSGSKNGPIVKSRAQAQAIGESKSGNSRSKRGVSRRKAMAKSHKAM